MKDTRVKKVIVIGFDGLEPKIVEAMQAAGELPNLSQLRAQGGYARLGTTYPALTPVAWSTFATGANPGRHGIFDFLTRDPKTYLPLLGLSRYEQKNAFVPPRAVNMRRGAPVWELLSGAGIPSVVIRCPCTYPPDNIQGKMLSGVGVPDLRGGLGTSTFYTSAAGVRAEHSENVIHVQPDGAGKIATHLIGPHNPKTRSDLTFEIALHLHPITRMVTVGSEGQPGTLQLKEGQWSNWLHVKFKIGMLQSVRGMVRFYLRRVEPVFELYASPINFDPQAPLFPISAPPEYAAELQSRLGSYYTTGMAEDHDGLNHGRFDEQAYLEQCAIVLKEREHMLQSELQGLTAGLLFCLFDTPDRLQHMFWRFREPGHPANGAAPSRALKRVIEDHYRELDSIVGRVLPAADDQTLLIVLSDHGMNSFQRGLNLNTWLYENGFLALKNSGRPGKENVDFFRNVDWGRTQAYALGLGGIYLNLSGREANGIIPATDAARIKTDLIKGLTGLCDTERGRVAVRSVVAREQIYSGPYTAEAPDLLVNFAEGYRVSWGTPLGGVPEGLFEDNTKKWGGDHAIDPGLVPGVLFMNRPFEPQGASLLDLAPTILAAQAVPRGPAMEGKSLLQ